MSSYKIDAKIKQLVIYLKNTKNLLWKNSKKLFQMELNAQSFTFN
jgi:hypothetical protein